MDPTQSRESLYEQASCQKQSAHQTQQDESTLQHMPPATLKHINQTNSICATGTQTAAACKNTGRTITSNKAILAHRPKLQSRPNSLAEKLQFNFTSLDPSPGEIKAQLKILLRRFLCEQMPASEADRIAEAFDVAITTPPITKKSLSELDICAIIVNPKLRHDVNFDRELHFRPNLDGNRGKEKLKDAERYWAALVAELVLYSALFDRSHGAVHDALWHSIAKVAQRRIPPLFEMLREILKHLVPERDQKRVEERLDKDMLMQEIQNGVCDLPGLSQWLAVLLKAHCAPMRDEWVDRMVKQTKAGVEAASPKSIVDGLKELFGILEAMKLDVANHQIRHLRPLLIEDTIKFEQKYQLTRISNRRKLDVESCIDWFTEAKKQARLRVSANDSVEISKFRQAHPEFVVFLGAILQLLLPNDSTTPIPPTMYLDVDRLRACKSELFDLVAFDICHQVFQWTAKRLAPSGSAPQLDAPAIQSLRNTLNVVVTEASTNSPKHWVQNISNLSVEIVRQAQTYCRVSQQTDVGLIEEVEGWLQDCFRTNIPIHAAVVEREIFQELLTLAEKHIGSSPVDLFNGLIAHAGPPPPPLPPTPARLLNISTTPSPPLMLSLPQDPSQAGPYVAVTRKIAHILILHWKVWSPLVYLRSNDQADSSSKPRRGRSLTEGNSSSSSETFVAGGESLCAHDDQLSVTSDDSESSDTVPSRDQRTVQEDEEQGAPATAANDAQPASC